jgi:WD40 repeat protein
VKKCQLNSLHLDIGCKILMVPFGLDRAFSSDEKFLAVNRSRGPCKVWDLNSSEVIANLAREAVSLFHTTCTDIFSALNVFLTCTFPG